MSIVSNNIITVECREMVSSKREGKIGEYETILNNPIPVYENSQVYIKSAFVDTASNNDGKIVVPEDINLTMGFVPYFVNFDEVLDAGGNNTELRTYQAGNQGAPPNNQFPDGKKYVKCSVSASQPVNQRQLLSINWNEEKPIPHDTKIGGDSYTFFYFDEQGQKHSVPLKAPRVDKTVSNCFNDVSSLNLQVIFNDPTQFGVELPSSWTKAGNNLSRTPVYHFGNNTAVGAKLNPDISTLTVKIPENKTGYDPAEVARIITDKFTTGLLDGNATTTNPAQNPLLQTSAMPSTNAVGKVDSYYVATDGSNIANFKVGSPDKYVGTSQFSLVFDETAKQFSFQALHTPYIFQGALGVELIPDLSNGNNFLCDSVGGILITSLSTDEAEGNFWFDKMGINPTIFSHPIYEQKTLGIFNNAFIPSFPIQLGENITANFSGLDYNIIKPAGLTLADRKNLLNVPALTDINGTTQTTVGIFNNKIFSEGQATSGYFLIEADIGLNNEFIGQQETNSKIKAILGRFYSKDSYTQGIDIGIPYTHRGQATSIQSIKIRILDQDHQPVGEQGGIGEDNCVFFEVKQ